jgi:hypothetical protein
MARPRILQAAGDLDRAPVPVGSSTNIELGDFLSYESGNIVLMDAAAEDATFAGYAVNQVSADFAEPDRVVVGLKGILRTDCTSAAYTFGQDLMYAAENSVVNASANSIAWSIEDTAAGNVTSLDILIDVLALGKLFAVTA